MIFPIDQKPQLFSIPLQNRFGGLRKYDIHTGVDIFCEDGTPVYAVEDGIVTNIAPFTGKEAGSPWWNNTMSCSIEGKSGVILYGELYYPVINIGDTIKEGDFIGKVKTVLKEDKGLPMCMLHIESYERGYRGDGEIWELDQNQPKQLTNIEDILFDVYGN